MIQHEALHGESRHDESIDFSIKDLTIQLAIQVELFKVESINGAIAPKEKRPFKHGLEFCD